MDGSAPQLRTPSERAEYSLLRLGHRVRLFPVSLIGAHLTARVPSSSLSEGLSFTQSPALYSGARVLGDLLMTPTQQDKSPGT